ncbi:3-hydroxyisobutyrate dehydrogenase [Durusdinium trenchii]|uniref:Mitochondrial n=1 Tax=Durusdinium trenchii TaxID=1381693 RepID=A0ABP0NKJ9_9DINO|eukprot:g25640.t1
MARFLCLAAVVITSHAENAAATESLANATNLTAPKLRGTGIPPKAPTNHTEGVGEAKAEPVNATEHEASQARAAWPGYAGSGYGSGYGSGLGGGFGGGGGWGPSNNWGWGHGKRGETCCMCSRMNRRGKTILFAGGDYDHYYGKRTAHQYCDQVCEVQCALQQGHKFGCYEEKDLIRMSQRYQGQSNFEIRHENHYGSIC